MAQVSLTKCDVCETNVSNVFCQQCRNFLCKPCETYHTKFPATRQHTVIDSQHVDLSYVSLKTLCEKHEKEYVHFCQECATLTCSKCVTTDHKNHSFTEISNAVADARQLVRDTILKIKSRIKVLLDIKEDIKSTQLTTIEKGHKQFEEDAQRISGDILAMVKNVTDLNINRVSDFAVIEKQRLESGLSKLEQSQNDHVLLLEKVEKLEKEKHDTTFYLYHKAVLGEVDLLDEIPKIDKPQQMERFSQDEFIKLVTENIQTNYPLRLSGFASKQLTQGNPNFADLNDKNRPTKIAERFLNIYDDEWITALENLTHAKRGSESTTKEQAIKMLMEIIKRVNAFCVIHALQQEQNIKVLWNQCVDNPFATYISVDLKRHNPTVVPPVVLSEFKSQQRAYNKKCLKNVIKECKTKTLTGLLKKENPAVEVYADRCTEALWLMAIQDPPMVISWPSEGSNFDHSIFNEYCRKGTVVKLPVWPAVHLNKDGVLISKGYAMPI